MQTTNGYPDLALIANSAHGSKRELYEQYGLRPLLAFFSHRVIRSGPRLLLYLAVFISALVVITRCLSVSITDLSIVASSGHLWRQHAGSDFGASSPSTYPTASEYESGLSGGGLRIVVFGENDVTTSTHPPTPHVHADQSNISWTQELCAELDCSTHLSFVPALRAPQRSLTSNKLYVEAVDSIVEKAKAESTPAHDFSFVSTAYPPRWEAPDLAAQVTSFLGRPKPARPPRETLWVFSFGFWDVWSLSAYPYNVAEGLISTFVAEIFYHIDTIYAASLDNNSVAFSDYANVAVPAGGGRDTNSDRLAWDDNSTDPFRVVLPLLLDPSIVPGWHLDRPEAPEFHTKSEQMRNAVRLTKRWNEVMLFEIEGWTKKNAELAVHDSVSHTAQDTRSSGKTRKHGASPPVNTSQKKRGAMTSIAGEPANVAETSATEAAGGDDRSDLRKTLWREAIIFRPSEYIMDVVIDGQMQAIGAVDKNGFGAFPKEDSFREVRHPCILPAEDAMLANATNEGGDSIKSWTSTVAAETVCNSPNDHLFLTPFSLGRRAVKEVGRISAAVVRMDRDARRKLQTALKPSMEPDRKPATWKLYFDMA